MTDTRTPREEIERKHGMIRRTLRRDKDGITHLIHMMEDGCLVSRSMYVNQQPTTPQVMSRIGKHTCWKHRWNRQETKTLTKLAALGYHLR